MWSMVGRAFILLLATTSVCTTASAGETVTYRGTGTYAVARTVLPMANGGAAIHLVNDTVATIAPSDIGFMFGDCAGLAYLSPTGKVTNSTYCTFSETAEDSFDVHGQGDGTEGAIKIIGGSGKWAGAAGTGIIKKKWAQDNRGTYVYEFTISTP